MKYRPEIDGLRTLAVVPIILFHAGIVGFGGGFVGVDIFFVISGYLITTIIQSEMRDGRFSLLDFYQRRARRILPALFLVLAVSLPVAWVLLLPDEMLEFSQSLAAVSTFTSNLFFWQHTGYWETKSAFQPLLHTWSLAVEEQFYLIFPLALLILSSRSRKLLLPAIAVVSLFSLGLAQWSANEHPAAAFYLLPTRAWELGLGAMIALYLLDKPIGHELKEPYVTATKSLGLVGLTLILLAVVYFDDSMPFPGLYALVPTIGAGLIILCSARDAIVVRLLSAKVLVGLGLISYGAYLWHQPLFAFARHASATPLSESMMMGLALLVVPIAYISWRFIEVPFRKRDWLSGKTILVLAACGSALFLASGLAGHLTKGFPERASAGQSRALLDDGSVRSNFGLGRACQGRIPLPAECSNSKSPEIVVWGDSYAMHLVNGIIASNPDAGVVQFTKNQCGPFFNVAPVGPPDFSTHLARRCLRFTEYMKGWLKVHPSVKYAVLSSPFDYYIHGRKLMNREGALVDTSMSKAVLEFEDTLSELESMGITPVVFSAPPANGSDLGRCVRRAEYSGENPDKCDFSLADAEKTAEGAYEFLSRLSSNRRVVRMDRLTCKGSNCISHIGSTPLYVDGGHLSIEGSKWLGRKSGFYSLIVDGP